jgi:hypothetical protein
MFSYLNIIIKVDADKDSEILRNTLLLVSEHWVKM